MFLIPVFSGESSQKYVQSNFAVTDGDYFDDAVWFANTYRQESKNLFIFRTCFRKEGCRFAMVVIYILTRTEFRQNDYRKDAPNFHVAHFGVSSSLEPQNCSSRDLHDD